MTIDRRRFLRETLATAALSPAVAAAQTAPPSAAPAIDIGRRFRERGLEGTFVLLAAHDDTALVHNPARADREYLPASTFKVPNSLIALETGAVRDENEVFKWDGQQRPVPEWNKDHTLRSAIAASVVWVYQEVARRIGPARMKEWVDRIGYGNRDISGGIDQFWLSGGLRITARQQIDFLRRLRADDLPFSARTRSIVKDILILERSEAWVLRGKTGLSGLGPGAVGWFVGWVERGDRAWFFASNMEVKEDTAVRRAIPRQILSDLGLT
jgi:beta-lactamase class D